ncbi:hypothetical protein G6F65_012676 [Rhizopus arrhizus]|nr:hypothetical protein G6F65_012676 [Rhizopus arrhizus]
MDLECLQIELNANMLMFKKIESRRVAEANGNGEETVEYLSAIPEPATENGMNVDEEEGMSNEEQLLHLLLLFAVLFQAKHLSVKAGEDLLAFLFFFIRSLGHGMEIPTKISNARTMVNYSSASNGLSRFLVCSACRSVYTSGSLHSRSCGYAAV